MTATLFKQNNSGVGFTFHSPAVYLEYWLNSWQNNKPLLDIGCGHGINTFQALERGAQVTATDLEQPCMPPHSRLTQLKARLPDQMPFSNNSFAGILCAEVFHFLPNGQVKPALEKLYRLLEPGGRLLITCVSCDVEVLKPTGLSKRVRQSCSQDPHHFYGQEDYIDLLTKAAEHFNNSTITLPIIKSHTQKIPDRHFHFFVPEQLASVMEETGFIIDVCELGPAPHYPVWLHGNKDQVRVCAHKQ